MSLHSSCTLVKLTIHSWDGFKKDKRVSEHIDVDFKTAGEAGNYNKRLLDKAVLKPITQTLNRARSEHARLTHAWCYDGVGLLPNELYFPYTAVMRDLQSSLDTHVDNLVQQLPIHIQNQRSKLGDLFRIDDYPQANEFKDRFSISLSFFPVPKSDHFVVDLAETEAQKLKTALTKELAQTQSAALRGLYDRVKDVVEHVYERLADPSNIFRDSLIKNVQQLVSVLPALNVFDDPVLNQVTNELKTKILIVDPDDLRTSKDARQEICDNAFDILALLKGEHAQLKQAA